MIITESPYLQCMQASESQAGLLPAYLSQLRKTGKKENSTLFVKTSLICPGSFVYLLCGQVKFCYPIWKYIVLGFFAMYKCCIAPRTLVTKTISHPSQPGHPLITIITFRCVIISRTYPGESIGWSISLSIGQ